jgi:hypothetical protein
MIHVVFNEADGEVLAKVFDLDPSMEGEIVVVRDDYALGPLENIYTPEGVEARRAWWKLVVEGGEPHAVAEAAKIDDEALLVQIKERLANDEAELLWIWAAQNKHDVCGYYWLVSQLADFQGRVEILYLNNLPFINEKGAIFYPDWLSQIQPKEFLKARKLARPVTTSEFEVDADEWNKICSAVSEVRLLEGGKKIVHKALDFYDAELAKFITPDLTKATKIIHGFLSKNKETAGEAFLLWRLKAMVRSAHYVVQGELKGLKDFEVKRQSAVEAAE